MNTRKKKLLVLMMTSAMMTCPVWASDETAAQPAPAAGATGYEPVGKDVVAADVVSAAGMSGTEKMAVNATITARADKATQDTMAAAQSGLTGYETEEELAAIAGGKTPEEIHKAAEVSSQETAAAEAAPGTGYEAAPQAAEPAAPAGTAQAAVPDASAQPAAAPVAPAAPAPKLPGTPVQFPARIGDFVVDTSVPNYPMAVIPPEGGVNLPYGSLVSDSDVAPYLNKTATSVTVSPVPDEKIEENILPRLAMRVGDAVNMAYIRHDLNVIGSTGIFSTVKPSFTNVPEGVMLNYTVQMNPVVNGIEITGNQSLSDGDIKKLITITPGSVLNTSIVSRDIAAINTTYNNAGYMLNRVSEVSLDEKGILHIGISEVHVEDISLRGNTKTRDKVILRELRFKKGDVFNREVASRSIQRVYNTGYFEDVNVRLLPGQKNAQDIIVEIDVVEQKTGTVTIGAGYSDSDGLVGILGLSETNLRGTGDKVSIQWEFGGETNSNKNYIFSYTHPWLNDQGDSIGFSLFDRENDYNDYDENGDEKADYDRQTRGFNITYGRVRSEYVSDFVTLETKETKYKDWNSGLNYPELSKDPDHPEYHDYMDDNFGRTNSLRWSHVFDNRDNVFDPTRGKRLSFTGVWAGNGLGGDFDYFKFIVENRLYYKVGHAHVIAVRLMGGIADGDMPYNDLFTLGGADNLRGYEDDEFRGDKMYLGTIEYRYPIAKKVQGVFFVDAGNAWGGTDKVPWYHDKDELHVAGGLGFRVTTPIGPIRLDYGVGDEGGKFHFSFGGKF
ncbi:BamA/TamA family outer membrane protein [Megasphaera hexanoica]|nr:BamA/TamA family outer membrane protein [Megasphaera hexanoica]